MIEESGYSFYAETKNAPTDWGRSIKGACELSSERLRPSLSNPDYLVYCARYVFFSKWINALPSHELVVLDVGGRIQPYRPLLGDKVKQYVAIDPQFNGLLDTVAVGEKLPFADNSFDLVLCTQVLGYVSDPAIVSSELHRVLMPGGVLLMSAPAFFPRHHDERWRFMPEGLKQLLMPFSVVNIEPEGCSVAGFFRTANVCLNLYVKSRVMRKITSRIVIPAFNVIGKTFDKYSGNNRLTANYSVRAVK